MICVNPNTKEFKEILAQVGDPFEAEVEYVKRYGADDASKIAEIEKEIKTLPIEIFDSVEVVANVSDDILGNEDISFAMKDVLNENGITDPLLINWAGINKEYFGHPKNIRSTEQLENLIKTIYNKKQKEDKYLEFKTNPLALKSFKEWKEALKEYPLAFQDAMLNHAIKHITNPQRKSKYVLQLSKVALTKAYGMVVNKPHELNRIGKLYDQEVLASVSDAVDHEPSASGNGYWVHVPRTEDARSKKSYYSSNYKTYKEFLEKTKEDIEKLKPLIEELEQIKLKKPVFTTQEPNVTRKDANKYDFYDYTYVRVESTYSRWDKNVTPKLYLRNQPHIEELGEDYEGYYIHGYNTELGKPEKKILPITKEQAKELWQAEIDRYPDNPAVGYKGEDKQNIYRLNDYKRNLNNLEEAIEKVKPEEWDIKEDNNFKVNVDLLRKLSPSTWCTASSMTEHYVANYDNYLLIVNGVTVAGIEVYPGEGRSVGSKPITTSITKEEYKKALAKKGEFTEDGFTYYIDISDNERYTRTGDMFYEKTEYKEDVYKRQVKEVTSRANNGVAPIDHLDDITAFFEKHNLDLDNYSVKRAIKAKAEGKTDKDYVNFDDEGRYYDPFEDQEPNLQYEEAFDYADYMEAQQELEQQRREWEEEKQFVSSITTEEEAKAHINLIRSHYESLNPTFRAIREIAEAAVMKDTHNIAHVDPTLPFYNDLAISAVNEWPAAFQYLSEAGKNIPGLKEIYDTHQEELDTLPFSKTNANLIQGYYDAKNDKVVVVAANTPVNEGAKVAIHEVAHRGMLRMAKELGGVQELAKALFAAEDQLMKKLPELLKRTGHKSLQSLMLDYGFTTESKEGKIKLLMELAARWAETLTDKPKPSWWKQFIESISKWITKFTGKILNENEVNELVGGFVKYGVKTNQRFAEQAPTQFDKDRLKAINELNDMVKNFRVDEILAEKGHDVKDFISNLETASNQDELDKIINKILYLLC